MTAVDYWSTIAGGDPYFEVDIISQKDCPTTDIRLSDDFELREKYEFTTDAPTRVRAYLKYGVELE